MKFDLGIQLDMIKEYDRVEWDFLEAIMLKMGFARDYVTLVMQCVSTVNFSVLVNGSLGKSFRPCRGLHQANPFSPYLFLFVNEVLSYLFQRATDLGFLEGIQISVNGPHLTHLLFADDTLIFLRT